MSKIFRRKDAEGERPLARFARSTTWKMLRPAAIFLLSAALAAVIILTGYNFLMNHFYRPIDPSDDTPVSVEIKGGSSVSAIARVLYDEQDDGEPGENQLIRNKAVFKVFVDFMGLGSKLRSGSYTMNRTMTIPQIVEQLAEGDGKVQEVVKFTLTEGMTVETMAESLVEQGVLSSTSRFLSLCKTRAGLTGNELIDIPSDTADERKYALEGYLFPDTYEVYAGASEETIINKLTNRFYGILSEDYILRAEELGMTIDQVVTMASLIEKEAKSADFTKVSAVFHNRLDAGMPLQSDASVQYLLGEKKLVFTTEELATDSPYNTYKNTGLPVGPICNPGKAAIEAALYPDEAYRNGNYLYFCLKEADSGELVFAKTLEEHNENVAKYKESWEQADENGQ